MITLNCPYKIFWKAHANYEKKKKLLTFSSQIILVSIGLKATRDSLMLPSDTESDPIYRIYIIINCTWAKKKYPSHGVMVSKQDLQTIGSKFSVDVSYYRLSAMTKLVDCILWYINSCRLFNAKSSLYIRILNIYDL